MFDFAVGLICSFLPRESVRELGNVNGVCAKKVAEYEMRNTFIPASTLLTLTNAKFRGSMVHMIKNMLFDLQTLYVSTPFPNTLTRLKFNQAFNQPIKPDVLPQNLLYLSFGELFNHPVARGVLPESLTWLTIHAEWEDENVLPPKLTFLNYTSYFYKLLRFPATLPTSLIHLKIGDVKTSIQPHWFPDTLKYFSIHCSNQSEKQKFPTQLHFLKI